MTPAYLKAAFITFAWMTASGMSTLNTDPRVTFQDLKDYATAVCLIEQKDDPYLKEQGFSWSAIMVHGSAIPLETLAIINDAVKKQFAKSSMVVVRDEASPTGSKAMPLVVCVRLPESPAVKQAINEVMTKIQ